MYDTSVKVGNPSKDGTESCPATTGMAIYTWGAQGVVAQRFLTVANGPGPVPVTIPDMEPSENIRVDSGSCTKGSLGGTLNQRRLAL